MNGFLEFLPLDYTSMDDEVFTFGDKFEFLLFGVHAGHEYNFSSLVLEPGLYLFSFLY